MNSNNFCSIQTKVDRAIINNLKPNYETSSGIPQPISLSV